MDLMKNKSSGPIFSNKFNCVSDCEKAFLASVAANLETFSSLLVEKLSCKNLARSVLGNTVSRVWFTPEPRKISFAEIFFSYLQERR